jgi:hypothetical protein
MARPAARGLTLLELLQSGGVRRVTELAGRLGVDGGPRTAVAQVLEPQRRRRDSVGLVLDLRGSTA